MECLRKLLLTGFVVFFYEGSALQIAFGLAVSFIFTVLYSKLDPYLMPSNNTFASYVHFQISFTLMLSLLIRVNERFSSEDKKSMKLNSEMLSYALLLSSLSVLLLGVFYILSAVVLPSSKDMTILVGEKKENN